MSRIIHFLRLFTTSMLGCCMFSLRHKPGTNVLALSIVQTSRNLKSYFHTVYISSPTCLLILPCCIISFLWKKKTYYLSINSVDIKFAGYTLCNCSCCTHSDNVQDFPLDYTWRDFTISRCLDAEDFNNFVL